MLAMRDAAALIIMQMDKATKISSLANGGVADPGVDTAVAEAEPKPAKVDMGAFVIGGIEDDAN